MDRSDRVEVFVFVIGILCAVLWARDAIGVVHGAFFPVLDPTLTITQISESDGETSIIQGKAKKVRDCEYIPGSLRWYEGTPARGVLKPATFLDKPKERDTGWTEWEGIRVLLGPTAILENSYATVQHACGWPWPITSIYYQSAAR